MAEKISKRAPWYTYISELEVLFEKDPEIAFYYANDENSETRFDVVLDVSSKEKCEALKKLLPSKKDFGGAIVFITVLLDGKNTSEQELYEAAFKNNPAIVGVVSREAFGGNLTYVSCSKNPVQFYDDNIGDLNGNKTMLLEEVARDVLTEHPVCFSTEPI